MKALAFLTLVVGMACPAFAVKIPDSAWQTGTLREIATDSHSRLHGVANGGIGVLNTSIYVVTHYVIDGPGYTYEANRVPSGRHPRQLLVTVHGPIKFALVGHDFYIQDDEGKTQKLIFILRSIKPADAK
jgi:hypothetical protein